MGNLWSKIWGSSTECGFGHIDNCVNCGPLAPECCCKCNPGAGFFKQCFWIAVDIIGVFFVGMGLMYVSDILLGGEESVSMFDELAEYMETGMKELFGVWKGMMGGIHGTIYNLFTGIGGNPTLSKMVAFTTTSALSLEGFTWFQGLAGKYATTCVGQIFDVINTPITFLKSTLFQSLGQVVASLADILLFPFELIVALISLIVFAVWKAINSLLGICSTGTCCGGASLIQELLEPLKNERTGTDRRDSRIRTPTVTKEPHCGCRASGTGVLPCKVAS